MIMQKEESEVIDQNNQQPTKDAKKVEASLPKNIPERSRKIADHSFSLIHHPNRHEYEGRSVKYDNECWKRSQIKRLFELYDIHGPQWKILSQNIPLRTANNLKNRFYTVLRNLVKLLFRKMGNVCPKLPGEIPSKDLSRLYDAREDYEIFGRFLANVLHQLNFDVENQEIDELVGKYSEEIIKIYNILYIDRLPHPKTTNEVSVKEDKDQQAQQAEKRQEIAIFQNNMMIPVGPQFGAMRSMPSVGFPMEQPNFYYWLMYQPSTFFLP